MATKSVSKILEFQDIFTKSLCIVSWKKIPEHTLDKPPIDIQYARDPERTPCEVGVPFKKPENVGHDFMDSAMANTSDL
jgi:tRNA A37 threonylcarbamoyladenosine biosynthesis protein TsaE